MDKYTIDIPEIVIYECAYKYMTKEKKVLLSNGEYGVLKKFRLVKNILLVKNKIIHETKTCI